MHRHVELRAAHILVVVNWVVCHHLHLVNILGHSHHHVIHLGQMGAYLGHLVHGGLVHIIISQTFGLLDDLLVFLAHLGRDFCIVDHCLDFTGGAHHVEAVEGIFSLVKGSLVLAVLPVQLLEPAQQVGQLTMLGLETRVIMPHLHLHLGSGPTTHLHGVVVGLHAGEGLEVGAESSQLVVTVREVALQPEPAAAAVEESAFDSFIVDVVAGGHGLLEHL